MILINSGPFGEGGEKVVSGQKSGAFRGIDLVVRN